MQFKTNGLILLVFGCFIRASLELSCIQCTSLTEHALAIWTHSCLDGTLAPLPCGRPANESTSFQTCISSLYKLGLKGNGGLHIHRSCSVIQTARVECDPPDTPIDLDTTQDFFCSRTCLTDGCNQHLVKEIFSNANEYFIKHNLFLTCFCMFSVQFYFYFWK